MASRFRKEPGHARLHPLETVMRGPATAKDLVSDLTQSRNDSFARALFDRASAAPASGNRRYQDT